MRRTVHVRGSGEDSGEEGVASAQGARHAPLTRPHYGALAALPWAGALLACATLGLAPFYPPHVFEKLRLLARGTLVRPIDWLDLALHGAPWLVLAAKALVSLALWRRARLRA
jgi:hypothetical protein